jgi:hypothetical protein
MMLEVSGRVQIPTAGTGSCGYSGIKQSLGISDIKQVMLDIKEQVQLDLQKNWTDDGHRDLLRVNAALSQVDGTVIDRPGWFSDFLAVHVAKAYGITLLIIRPNGFFSFFQVESSNNLVPSEFMLVLLTICNHVCSE